MVTQSLKDTAELTGHATQSTEHKNHIQVTRQSVQDVQQRLQGTQHCLLRTQQILQGDSRAFRELRSF